LNAVKMSMPCAVWLMIWLQAAFTGHAGRLPKKVAGYG
jgi:hypothetical protein